MKDVHGGNIWEASSGAGLAPKDITDFSASINPLGMPKAAYRAVKGALTLAGPYPEPDARSLASAISEAHGIDPAHVMAGNGSTELIYLLPRLLKPRKALIAEPAFSEYRTALTSSGCRVASLIGRPSSSFGLDLGRLDKALAKGYDIFFLANPANPTGLALERDVVLEAARICARRSTAFVVDEAFADFCDGVSIKKDAGRLKNTIVLRSLTKFYSMAGLRLGFLTSSARLIKGLGSVKPPWSVNTLASVAGINALKDRRYIERSLKWLRVERPFLYDGLGSVRGITPYPSSANYIMARIDRQGMDALSLRDRLFKDSLLIRELSGFRGLGRAYFRVAVRSREDNSLLIERVKKAFG